jgi:hypothetical protein
MFIVSPEDGIFSTTKHVVAREDFPYMYFSFLYELYSMHVVVLVGTRNGQF